MAEMEFKQLIDTVMEIVNGQLPQFEGYCWELLCRNYVSGNMIDGIVYNLASRWWGKIWLFANFGAHRTKA